MTFIFNLFVLTLWFILTSLHAETGLNAWYYNGTYFDTYKFTQTDSQINFDWGSGSPSSSYLGNDTFSIKWSGYLHVSETGYYLFKTYSDDGMLVDLDNTRIAGDWSDHGAAYSAWSGYQYLEANTNYPITVYYYENGGYAVSKLYWLKPDNTEEIVPSSVLSTIPVTTYSYDKPSFSECGAFPDALSTSQTMILNEDVEVINSGSDLTAPSSSFSANKAECDGSTCTATNTSPTILDLPTFQTSSSSTDLTIDSDDETTTLTDSEYRTVSGPSSSKNDHTLVFDPANGEVMKIDNLQDRGNIRRYVFKAGDYWIDDWTISNSDEVDIDIQGEVRLFVTQFTASSKNLDFNHANNNAYSTNDPKDLHLYIYGSFHFGGGGTDNTSNFNGYIYSRGAVAIENKVSLKGAITAAYDYTGASITINQRGTYEYYNDGLTGTGFENCTSDIDLDSSNLREFSLRYGGSDLNIYGDIAATGSSAICAKNSSGGCDWSYSGNMYDIDAKYVEDDHSISLNSSSASLSLPDYIKGSDIIWAGLYWHGHIFNRDPDTKSDKTDSFNQVTLKTPNGKSHAVTATLSKEDTNWYTFSSNSGFRFFYQAYADVTSYIQESYSTSDNTFTVGNIKVTDGSDYGVSDPKFDNDSIRYGPFGGWMLLVVYKADSDNQSQLPMKNISIFDGYKVLIPTKNDGSAGKTIDINVDGFITPSSGDISSTLLFYGGGSEKSIKRDYLQVKNSSGDFNKIGTTLNPSNNVLNDSITAFDTQVNTSRTYYPGVDIDLFDTGRYLENSQSSTTLQLWTSFKGGSGDQVFTGALGFSTELYTPQVCYYETIYSSLIMHCDSGSCTIDPASSELASTGSVKLNDELAFVVQIANEDKQQVEQLSLKVNYNDNNHVLSYVKANDYCDDTDGSACSMFTGQEVDDNATDFRQLSYDPSSDESDSQDYAEYNSDDNVSYYRIGEDPLATDSDYELGDEGPSVNHGVLKEAKMSVIIYKAKVNTNEESNITNSYYVTYRYYDDALAQWIVKEDQEVQACSGFSSQMVNVQSSGSFALTDEPGSCDGGIKTKITGENETFYILFCDADNSPSSYTGTIIVLVDDNNDTSDLSGTYQTSVSFSNSSKESFSFTLNTAFQNTYIKAYDKDNEENVSVSERFSIRPDELTLTFQNPGTDLTAGKHYSNKLTLSAAQNYNQSESNLTINAIKYQSDGSMNNSLPGTISLSINGGEFNGSTTVNADLNYTEVGEIDINISDSQWTSQDSAADKCIRNSTSNTKNADDKYGCVAFGQTSDKQEFFPHDFNVSLDTSTDITNANGGSFTYLASDASSQGATIASIELTITARNALGDTTQNYDSDTGYEKNVDIETNITSIRTDITHTGLGDINLSNQDINFSNGTRTLTLNNFAFNYGRDSTTPEEPFEINGTEGDLNLSVAVRDAKNITGSSGNHPFGGSATFIYGRINPMDTSKTGPTISTEMYYEVYAKDERDSLKTLLGTSSLTKSPNNVYWWRNTLEDSSYFTITDFKRNTPGCSFDATVTSGVQQITDCTENTLPKRHRIEIEHDGDNDFLFFNRTQSDEITSFYLHFLENPTTATGDEIIEHEGRNIRRIDRIGE